MLKSRQFKNLLIEYLGLDDYVICMNMSLEEYVDNKYNSDWITDYNRGILDWQIEYYGKDPSSLNPTKS